MPLKQNIDLVIIWRMLISEYGISCIRRQTFICD